MNEKEYEIATLSQEKFQFYAVALVFTILGLSIQTASFDGHVAAKICELLSWLSLLVSGLLGLSFIEWNPVIRFQMLRKDEFANKKYQLETNKEQGVQEVNVVQDKKIIPIGEHINHYESYVTKLDSQIKKLNRKADIKYSLFKWAFALGVVLLTVGRAITPVMKIIDELCSAT